jgi:hypothetical protein
MGGGWNWHRIVSSDGISVLKLQVLVAESYKVSQSVSKLVT